MYSELIQTSKIELFAKAVNGLQPLNIFAESSVIDIYQNPEQVCGIGNMFLLIQIFIEHTNWFRFHNSQFYVNNLQKQPFTEVLQNTFS